MTLSTCPERADSTGHDYLKTICEDIGHAVVARIESLPSRLPMLYRKLTE